MKLSARVCVWSLAAVLATAAAGTAQVEITAEPSHHLVLQNSNVRVFRVGVAPGSATLLHQHRHDYVYVVLGDAQITNEIPGKPSAALRLGDGEVRFVPGGFAHVMRDRANTPFRNVTIELLRDAELRKQPVKWEEERGMSILNGGTQDILFVQDSVRVSEVQLQPGGVIPRHAHKSAHLMVAVTDLHLESNLMEPGKTRGKRPVELKAGNVLWVPGGFTHTLKNTSNQDAKYITLEFP